MLADDAPEERCEVCCDRPPVRDHLLEEVVDAAPLRVELAEVICVLGVLFTELLEPRLPALLELNDVSGEELFGYVTIRGVSSLSHAGHWTPAHPPQQAVGV